MRNDIPVKPDLLKEFVYKIFAAAGVPDRDAALCADVLVAADLRGIDSHGVGRLKSFYIDRIRYGTLQAVTEPELVRSTCTTSLIDGHDGMGMVVGEYAMNRAIESAAKYGVGVAVVRNSSHFGIAGYYSMMASKRNLIGMCCTNARPSIAPTFGVDNLLGTNPIAIALPSEDEFDFVLDFATSVAQRGKVELYNRLGKTLPDNWVIGSDGRTRTDAAEVLAMLGKGEAALLPLGGAGEEGSGYKGYGLATVVEILSAALQQGTFLKGLMDIAPDGTRKPCHIGHFFMAMDIAAFTDPAAFRHTVGEILRTLRNSRRVPGSERIYTAGEKEYLTMCSRRADGIPLVRSVIDELHKLKGDYGIETPLLWS